MARHSKHPPIVNGTFFACQNVVVWIRIIKEEENTKEEPITKISFVDKCLPTRIHSGKTIWIKQLFKGETSENVNYLMFWGKKRLKMFLNRYG